MKKLIASVLALICILGLVGCNSATADLQKRFPEYYNLSAFKGIEVYAWQTEDGKYLCGALSGTNRNKTPEEISSLTMNAATLEEMKAILSSYGIDKEEIIIIPIKINSERFEIVPDDFTKISEAFWSN